MPPYGHSRSGEIDAEIGLQRGHPRLVVWQGLLLADAIPGGDQDVVRKRDTAVRRHQRAELLPREIGLRRRLVKVAGSLEIG